MLQSFERAAGFLNDRQAYLHTSWPSGICGTCMGVIYTLHESRDFQARDVDLIIPAQFTVFLSLIGSANRLSNNWYRTVHDMASCNYL